MTTPKKHEYGLEEFSQRQIYQLANIGLSLLVDALHGDDDDIAVENAVNTATDFGLIYYHGDSSDWRFPGSGVARFGYGHRPPEDSA